MGLVADGGTATSSFQSVAGTCKRCATTHHGQIVRNSKPVKHKSQNVQEEAGPHNDSAKGASAVNCEGQRAVADGRTCRHS